MTVHELVQVFEVNTSMEETPMRHYKVHVCQKITLIIRRKFREKNMVTYNNAYAGKCINVLLLCAFICTNSDQ